jgi:hypothetical protein
MRHVGRFNRLDFRRQKLERQCCKRIVEMVRLGHSDNWRDDGGFLKNPRERHLGARDLAAFRDHADRIDNLLIGGEGLLVEIAAKRVALLALTRFVRGPRQATPSPAGSTG